MNKTELVDAMATLAAMSKVDASKALEAFTQAVTNHLAEDKKNEVRLVGFGTFTITERKASEGRNPKTGEAIQIKASLSPKFKAGKGLKEAVNKTTDDEDEGEDA